MTSAGLSVRRAAAALLAITLSAQMPFARAEIVDTDALAARSQAELERAKVQSFAERADVKQRLQAMGLGGMVAAERVASLSESEVHALAQRIDSLPAGGTLSQQDWILILLVILLVVVLI